MECVLEKDDLLHCLSLAQGVAEKRSTMPILAHVLIECRADVVSMSATDLEIGLRQQCRATVAAHGAVTADARKLYEIIRELPPERVAIRSAGTGWVEVSSGRSRFRLAGLDPQEFPAIGHPAASPAGHAGKTSPARVVLPGETVREMIEKTLFATSPDETRLSLSGVLVEAPKEGMLRMVASDGHRLALIEREAKVADPSTWPKAILPRKGLVEAQKLLARTQGDVTLSMQGSSAGLVRDGAELIMRLVEGEFPDYRQVIPQKPTHTVRCAPGDLLGALRRVLVLTTERSRGVKLHIAADRMTISVSTPDLGEGVEEIAVRHDGDPITIGFNCRYLTDVLQVIGEANTITIRLTDEESPALLETDGDPSFSYVVMPMRIF